VNKVLVLHATQDKDTLVAGQDYIANIWVEGTIPGDCVCVMGYGKSLPIVQDRFIYRRITKATSFDYNGFSKQMIRFKGIINRSGKDTIIFIEKIFWVQRSEQ